MKRSRAMALTVLAGLGACAGHEARQPDPIRAVWVTRFDYKTRDDVRRVMDDCAGLGFNTVMFQVRGNGTAFYASSFEPWAEELGGADPGFDPLAEAIEAAHARDLALHAWVNVMPSWRGDKPPQDPAQLWHAHPEWHLYDQQGVREPLQKSFYVSLNPCRPEVREYLVGVLGEIVRSYAVDGLHLDYVRFVDDLAPPDRDYPRDPETLRRYREATGRSPEQDPAAWKRWKADQVTALVAALRAEVRDAGTGAWLSAAVGSTPEGPLDKHQRDSRTWIERGLVDAVFPMNYTADVEAFRSRVQAWSAHRHQVRVVTGIQASPDRDPEVLQAELRAALAAGRDFCVFAYAHLFGGPTDEQAARMRIRAVVRRHVGGATLET